MKKALSVLGRIIIYPALGFNESIFSSPNPSLYGELREYQFYLYQEFYTQ